MTSHFIKSHIIGATNHSGLWITLDWSGMDARVSDAAETRGLHCATDQNDLHNTNDPLMLASCLLTSSASFLKLLCLNCNIISK